MKCLFSITYEASDDTELDYPQEVVEASGKPQLLIACLHHVL